MDGKECGEGYEYICGCIFHGSHACVGGKPEEYGKVTGPVLGPLNRSMVQHEKDWLKHSVLHKKLHWD